MSEGSKITAAELRDEIWDVFQMTKSKEISHEVANASTASARELLKTFALEQKVRSMEADPGLSLKKFFEIE